MGLSARMYEHMPTRTFKMLFVLFIFIWNFKEGTYGLPGEQTTFFSVYHRLKLGTALICIQFYLTVYLTATPFVVSYRPDFKQSGIVRPRGRECYDISWQCFALIKADATL